MADKTYRICDMNVLGDAGGSSQTYHGGGDEGGRIVFDGEPLTLNGEPILSGDTEDMELADALAALSGNISIGGGGATTVTLASLTISQGGLNIVGAGISAEGEITGAGFRATDMFTSDPNFGGAFWNDAGAVKLSAG